MPVIGPSSTGQYPTIESVFNLTRVHLNDTFAGATNTVGEGRVFIDTWTPSITILNQAMARFQRDLSNRGVPTTREEVFIASLAPVNGPSGSGVPDPNVQQYLNFSGFWDGSGFNSSLTLPSDLIVPLRLEERDSNSGVNYTPVDYATDGLPSVLQNWSLGRWEWRGDAIFFNGAIINKDVRLRYTGGKPRFPVNLSPTLFSATTIPFLDSEEPLSYLCAYIFSSPRVPRGGAEDLLANYESTMQEVANTAIRLLQRTPVCRQPFGYEGAYFGY